MMQFHPGLLAGMPSMGPAPCQAPPMYGQATALQPHQQVAVGPDSYANFGLSPFAPAPAPLLVHPFDLFAGTFSFPGVDCDPSGRTGPLGCKQQQQQQGMHMGAPQQQQQQQHNMQEMKPANMYAAHTPSPGLNVLFEGTMHPGLPTMPPPDAWQMAGPPHYPAALPALMPGSQLPVLDQTPSPVPFGLLPPAFMGQPGMHLAGAQMPPQQPPPAGMMLQQQPMPSMPGLAMPVPMPVPNLQLMPPHMINTTPPTPTSQNGSPHPPQPAHGSSDVLGEDAKREKRKQSNRDSARRSRLRKLAECEQLGVKVNTMESKRHELETALVRFQAAASKLEAHNSMLRKGIDLLNSHQRLPEGLRKAEADLAAALAKASRNLWEGPVHSEAEEEEEEHDEDDGEGSEDASPQHTEGHNVNVQGMQGQEHHMPPGAAYSADPAAATGAAPAAASAAVVHNAAAAKAHSRGHGTAGMALKPDQHATTEGQAHPSAAAGMHAAGSCHAHSKQQSPQHKAQHQKSTKGDGSHAAGRHAKAPGAAAEAGGTLGSHVSASSLAPFGHGPNACAVVHGPQAGSSSGITSTTSGQYEGSAGFSPMTAHLLQIDTTSRLAPPALHGGVAAEPACMQPQSMQSTRHSSLERPLSTDTGLPVGGRNSTSFMNLPTLQRHAPYLPGVEASGAAVMYEPTPGQLEQRALSPLPLLVMGSFNGTPIAEDQLESMAAAADGVMETAVMEGVMEECDSWAQEDQAALVQRVESGRVGSGLAQVRGRGCGNGLVDELVTPLDTGGDEEGDQQQQGPSTGGRGLLEESASLMGMENTPSDSPACGLPSDGLQLSAGCHKASAAWPRRLHQQLTAADSSGMAGSDLRSTGSGSGGRSKGDVALCSSSDEGIMGLMSLDAAQAELQAMDSEYGWGNTPGTGGAE